MVAPSESSTADVLRFGRCELHRAARELRVDGTPAKVGERGFDLLLALADARGEVVTRDALLDGVWRGIVVGDENLKVQVMALRKLLGAQAIVTAPRRGYRLGWPVTVSAAAGGTAQRPPAQGLIGRAAELDTLLGALRPGALVTLVGPGGVGKTRLALAAARAAQPLYADGVRIVELAALTDPALLPGMVARALDLPPLGESPSAERIARALAPLSMLIVLDNCEHLLDAVAALTSALVATAPRLTVLATSQQPLGLSGETPLRLQGLAVASQPSDDAAALFVARVRRVDPSFEADAAAHAAIAQICRGLGGLPLAIELAAARVPLLGVAGVQARVDQPLPLLAGGARDAPARHQTLRAAMQWSHALLTAREQQLFRRLGVFADSFAVESAVTVAGTADEWDVVDALGGLVDKSLVQTHDAQGQRRLRLLVTAREFALERLAEAGEDGAARDLHAQALLDRLDAAEAGYFSAALRPWTQGLWLEAADLRAALRWCARPGADPQRLFALVGAAGGFWAAAQLDAEAQPWLAAVRSLADDPRTPPLRSALYWQACALRSVTPTAPIVAAVHAAERAEVLYRELGHAIGEYRMLSIRVQHGRRVDPALDVHALLDRMQALESPQWTAAQRLARMRAQAVVMARAGDWAGYRDRCAAEVQALRDNGDTLREWGALYHVALAEVALGQPRRAVEVLEPVVAGLRDAGLTRTLWTRPCALTMARIEAGGGPAAAASVLEAITLLQVADAPGWLSDHFAWWAAQCGAHEDGARLLGWSDRWYERRGEPRHTHAVAASRSALDALQHGLGAARVQALRDEGRALPDAVALQMVRRLAEGSE